MTSQDREVTSPSAEPRRDSETPARPEALRAESDVVSPLESPLEETRSDVLSATDLSTVRSESTQVDDAANLEQLAASKDSLKDEPAASKDPKGKAAVSDPEAQSTADTEVAESTSPLFKLPENLLLRILELVGPHHLRADAARLAVCKQWLPLAQTVLFRELRLTPAKLERLFDGASAAKVPLNVVECVYVDLHGYWGIVRAAGTEALDTHGWDEQRKARRKWIDDLNRNIGKLRSLLKSCPRLWGLSIHPRSEQKPNATKSAAAAKENLRQYLDAEKLLSLWQFKSLTVLELDLTFMRSPLKQPLVYAGKADPTHLCPRIAPLLRQLVSLTIRATEVCAELLLVADSEINPKLLTIYLELGRMVSDKDGPNWWKDVSQCENSRTWSPTDNFRGNLEQRLEQIARLVESPQRVWLTYVVPGDKTIVREAYDAVRRKRLRLDFESRKWEEKTSSTSTS